MDTTAPRTHEPGRIPGWLRAYAPELRFALLLPVPTGSGDILLLKKRPNPVPEEAP